jgi:AraC-like DNA-binding protein
MSTPAGPGSLSLRRYGASPGSHAHAHFQVLWGWQGTLELEIEGRGHRMTAGRAVVIAPGDRHDFWSPGGSACFVVDTADTAPVLPALAGRPVTIDPATRHLLRFLAAREDLAGHLSDEAAALLLASLPAPRPGLRPVRTGRTIDWAALDAWVDAHLHAPLSVALLAERVHLSPSQFAARCQAERGLAPMAYVRQRRLVAARRLREAGWQVQRIAEHCGYRSPSALTAALRRDER